MTGHYTKAEIEAILIRHDESGERNPLAFSVQMAAIIQQFLREKGEMEARIQELGADCLNRRLEENADVFKRLKDR